MSISIKIYNCLLSSPRGIDADREAVRTAIGEANRFLKTSALQVDVLDWEEDVRPTVGADGQDVVNSQICAAADFGIVLIHDRIGSVNRQRQRELFLE